VVHRLNKRSGVVHCLIVIAPALAGAVSGHGADRRPDRSVLTVVTLNAELLRDGVEPEEGRVER
jgi:hypothetical protein